MLSPGRQEMISKLSDGGMKPAQIARRLRVSIGTVLKYKALGRRIKEPSAFSVPVSRKLVDFQEYIEQYLKCRNNNVSKLFEELQRIGYRGSYALLNSYVRTVLPAKAKKYKRSVRVETGPGEQAQVDWGSFGQVRLGGRVEKLYAFVYVLSYSRAVYVEFVVRQNQQTFQNCHIHAFDRLGIPKTIRYDNVKTVILRREKLADGTQKLHLNPAFEDFARYYGFETFLCPPYWPRAKGKVEAGVKYLRYNFIQGKNYKRSPTSLEEINESATRWLYQTANNRIHRTTNEKPQDRWLKEREFLKFPKGLPVYVTTPLLTRWSTKDGLVQYRSNAYSVPMAFSQKALSIREVADHGLPHLEIY